MPEVQQVHIDAALTNVSLAYRNHDFIAEQLAPRVAVRKQSDRYYVYDSEREAIRPSFDLRSPGSLAAEVDYTLSSESYFCSDHALASAVTDEERENADPALQPHIDRTEFLTERILLNQEVALHNLLQTSPLIQEKALSPTDAWTTGASDPIADVREARMAIFESSQRRANIMVLPFKVYELLRSHPAVTEAIKYGGQPMATPAVLADLFDVDRVLVPRACANTATPGQPPHVESVWEPAVYLAHVAPRPGLKQVTLAHTFVWNGTPGSENGTLVERWRENGRKADMVRVQKYYDIKLIAPGAGFRVTGIMD